MAKSKKSKILAMALCASVMTGIYASPVMAEALSVTLDGQGIVAVVLGGTEQHDVTGTFTIDGSKIATALTDTNLTLNSVTANTIGNTGNNFFVGADGNVTANSVTTTVDVVVGTYSLKDIGVKTQNMNATEGDTAFTGNVSATGTLKAGDTTLANTTVGGTLDVTGETTVESLDVTKNATVGGTLNVAGETTVDSLGVTKNATVNGTLKAGATTVDSLTVKGAAKVNSLEVTDSATVGDKLTVDNGLDVTGNALLNNDLTVNGATKLNGDVTVGGEAKFNEKATFNGKAIFNENIDVNGFANLNSGAKVNGELTVNGATKVNNDLTVNGNALVNGSLDISNGKFKVDAAGNTEFNGNLNIGHDAFEVTAADGSFNAASENFKVSADGVINADSLYLQTYGGGTLEVGEALQALTDANLPDKVGGIERNPAGAGVPGDGTTTIENGAKFTETAMTMGDTIVESGKITVGAADNQTIIDGGAITAKSLLLDGKNVGETIFGIEREGGVTTIEGATSFDATGMSIKNTDGFGTSLGVASMEITAADGLSTRFTAGGATFVGASGTTNINGGAIDTTTINGVDFSEWHSEVNGRLYDLEYKTQNIKPGAGTGTGTGEGGASGLTGGEDTITVPDTAPGHTGITGDVTVGGEINAGEIVVGDKGSDNKTTIDGGNVTVNGGENGSTTINGGNITTGDTTIDGDGIKTGNGKFTGNVDVDGEVTVGDGTTITGEGITTGTGTFDDVIIGENTTIDSDGIYTNDITAGTGTIGNVYMDNTGITVGGGTTITEDTVKTDNIKADDGEFDSQVTVGDNTTITDGNINLGGDNGTNINADGMIVGNANGVNTNVSAGDVVITDKDGKDIALSDVGYVENIDRELQANGNYDGTVVGGINAEADIRRAEVNRLDNRISKVEDRVDKVGAMSAAIANLRTMGYEPAAPTEIAVGVGQYRSETGVALGMFHYPNKDFMLSLSVSTSGDEVMGGIGATWKFGRKSPEKVAEIKKAQAEADARRAEEAKLAKAEEMKQAAKEAKIKAQQERHAKLAAQAEAAK